MQTLSRILSSAVEKLMFHPVTITGVEAVCESFRLLTMQGVGFQSVKWIPGQTVQWGDSGADEDNQNRTGAFWTVASWIVGGPDDSAMHTPHLRVSPGDVLVGVIKLSKQSSAGFVYSCEFQGMDGTTLLTSPIAELVYCVETLEAYELQGSHTPPYDLDSISEYPAAPVSFGNIQVVTSAPGQQGHGIHTMSLPTTLNKRQSQRTQL